jgi:hypothetical protein
MSNIFSWQNISGYFRLVLVFKVLNEILLFGPTSLDSSVFTMIIAFVLHPRVSCVIFVAANLIPVQWRVYRAHTRVADS